MLPPGIAILKLQIKVFVFQFHLLFLFDTLIDRKAFLEHTEKAREGITLNCPHEVEIWSTRQPFIGNIKIGSGGQSI